MKSLILKTVILAIALIVGTVTACWGYGFETAPTTLRGNGMGLLGAALVDNQSYYYNPGSLGILALDNRIAAGSYIRNSTLFSSLKLYHGNLAVRLTDFELGGGTAALGLAYTIRDVDYTLMETTYEYPEGTGTLLERGSTLHSFTLGLAYRSGFEFGLGMTVGYSKEAKDSPLKDYFTYSLGVMVRYPFLHNEALAFDEDHRFVIIPAVGLSYNNFGPDIEAELIGWMRPTRIEQLKIARLGLALELGIDNTTSFGNWRLVSLLPTVEWANMPIWDTYRREGGELGLMEALYARIGYATADGPWGETTTYGFSVRSSGLAKLFLSVIGKRHQKPSATADFLVNNLSLEYCSAHDDFFSSLSYGFQGLLLNLEF